MFDRLAYLAGKTDAEFGININPFMTPNCRENWEEGHKSFVKVNPVPKRSHILTTMQLSKRGRNKRPEKFFL